jgi:hypothetical protein
VFYIDSSINVNFYVFDMFLFPELFILSNKIEYKFLASRKTILFLKPFDNFNKDLILSKNI